MMQPSFVRLWATAMSLLLSYVVLGQQPVLPQNNKDTLKEFEIIRGPSMRMLKTDTGTLQIIAGGAVVHQGGTKFNADSVVLNNDTRIMQSFGNVHINDGDTVQIYSQYLLYNGISRFSYLRKDVRLTGRKGTLTTNELDYGSESGIGNYYHGGKIINEGNVITSRRGTYYADTRDVYFKDDVKMDGPKDHIRSDSLIYNMNDGNITFVSDTYIKNAEAEIRTSEGRYDTNKGDAFFSSRTNVRDSSGIIYTANNMALEGKTGNAQLEGNAVIIDSADGFNLISDQVFINRQNNSFLATKKPLLIIKRESDSTYVAADTIFSGLSRMVDSIMLNNSRPLIGDTLSAEDIPDSAKGMKPEKPLLSKGKLSAEGHAKDSVRALPLSGISFATQKAGRIPEDSSFVHFDGDRLLTETAMRPALKRPKILRGPRPKVALTVSEKKADEEKSKAEPPEDRIDIGEIANVDSLSLAGIPDTAVKVPDSTRYFIAYHHVRIFNDSLQSVCDSLFISSADSTFKLYKDPVLWSGHTQVTGDTMFLYTKNKEADQLYVFDRALVVSRTTEGFFNQVGGKTLRSYFIDNQFDSIQIRGSQSESIYYLQDSDSAYIGIDRSTGDVIKMLFDHGELDKMIYINEVHSHMYPMGHMPEDQKYLKGFEWLDKRRPKNRAELFQ